MITFINERSIEPFSDLCACLTFFFRASQSLSNGGVPLRKDSSFFGGDWFRKSFNGIRIPSDLKAELRELAFGSRFATCWRAGRISEKDDLYLCPGIRAEILDESLCEAAELRLRDYHDRIAVLSMADSKFGGTDLIEMVRVQSNESATLGNARSLDEILRWLAADRGQYDPASTTAPHDFQTILVKCPDRFHRTSRRERRFRRTIFEEIPTHRRYYVDDGHPGPSAHLEVFSSTGEHLGTADINCGDLDTRNKVSGRVLRE